MKTMQWVAGNIGASIVGCLISWPAIAANTCYSSPASAGSCGGTAQITGLSSATCSACYSNAAGTQCGCCWNGSAEQCSIQNCPNLNTYTPAAAPNPTTGWTCNNLVYNTVNGPQGYNGNKNYYSCVSGSSVCLGWTPPSGAIKGTDPNCATTCAPGNTPPKGQCASVSVKTCTPTIETTSTLSGTTYYLCSPGATVYYYSCPSSSSAPSGATAPLGASEETMPRTTPGLRNGRVIPSTNHPGAFVSKPQ